jgi:hypothetical protein
MHCNLVLQQQQQQQRWPAKRISNNAAVFSLQGRQLQKPSIHFGRKVHLQKRHDQRQLVEKPVAPRIGTVPAADINMTTYQPRSLIFKSPVIEDNGSSRQQYQPAVSKQSSPHPQQEQQSNTPDNLVTTVDRGAEMQQVADFEAVVLGCLQAAGFEADDAAVVPAFEFQSRARANPPIDLQHTAGDNDDSLGAADGTAAVNLPALAVAGDSRNFSALLPPPECHLVTPAILTAGSASSAGSRQDCISPDEIANNPGTSCPPWLMFPDHGIAAAASPAAAAATSGGLDQRVAGAVTAAAAAKLTRLNPPAPDDDLVESVDFHDLLLDILRSQ